jgi:glutathione S-transferase
MLQHKGIEHDLVKLAPGAHAFRVRLAGFRGATVPALRLNGRRVVGSRRISRLLDEVKPEPPLFPAVPARRRAVEEAEEWGDTVLQPIPRRLLRWAIRHHTDARVMFVRALGSSRPELVARVMGPVAAFYARLVSGRPIEHLARRIMPEYPYRVPSLMRFLR